MKRKTIREYCCSNSCIVATAVDIVAVAVDGSVVIVGAVAAVAAVTAIALL